MKQNETETLYTTSHTPRFITPRKESVLQEFGADAFLLSNRTWILYLPGYWFSSIKEIIMKVSFKVMCKPFLATEIRAEATEVADAGYIPHSIG